ncbi:amidase [Modicisalibacter coralii]|uniref:amidase n=1 Tax=Modicisalibacter coralii TaxID=2304602 RepID=UPI00100B952A|nr:amidase family protein [Halomonas coralii]
MHDELHYLSARDCLTRFADGSLSPVTLLDALIERAREVEPLINAFTFTYFDEAREQARQAERAWRDGTARPLEGLPVAVKDEQMVAGQRTSNASPALDGFVADYTDPLVQRLLDAGAIIHARTATPEMSMAFVTWSKQWGVTRNPWNPAITPGGSSGGSGAALAAGTTVVATGSDIGGSIRIPSAMTGNVGFKPPWGRVPEVSPWNQEQYAQGGALARSVDDLILIQNLLAGPHPQDMNALPAYTIPQRQAGLAGMRIALSPDLGYLEVDAEMRRALAAAADDLRALGAEVESVDIGFTAAIGDIAMQHYRYQSGHLLRRLYADIPREAISPYLLELLDEGQELDMGHELDNWHQADRLHATLHDRVYGAGFEALICPTLVTADIPADHDHSRDTLTVDGRARQGLTQCTLTYPFNVLNRHPVLNMPIGMAANGVPIGMQIVAPRYADAVAFRIAAALETRSPTPIMAGQRPDFAHRRS